LVSFIDGGAEDACVHAIVNYRQFDGAEVSFRLVGSELANRDHVGCTLQRGALDALNP